MHTLRWLWSAWRNFRGEFVMCWRRAVLKRDNAMTVMNAWEHLKRSCGHVLSQEFRVYSITGKWTKP